MGPYSTGPIICEVLNLHAVMLPINNKVLITIPFSEFSPLSIGKPWFFAYSSRLSIFPKPYALKRHLVPEPNKPVIICCSHAFSGYSYDAYRVMVIALGKLFAYPISNRCPWNLLVPIPAYYVRFLPCEKCFFLLLLTLKVDESTIQALVTIQSTRRKSSALPLRQYLQMPLDLDAPYLSSLIP